MYKSQESRQTLKSSNDAPLNKAKEIKVEIQQKGSTLTSVGAITIIMEITQLETE